MKTYVSRYSVSLLVVLTCSALLAAPAVQSQGWQSNWPQAYIDALYDTMGDTTESEVYKNLIAIVPSNTDLIRDAEGRVLVATWGDDFYTDNFKPGDTFTVSPAHIVWVTVVPELKNWINEHAVSEENLTLRLEQLYGLPPDTGKTVLVEFWVDPDDLFRPSPDPEITDHECELDFPVSPYTTISQDYIDWFNNEKSTHYTGSSASPWTRLGYTYDWGNPVNHVGLSEFIIQGNATCVINALTATADYCTLPSVVLDMGADTASPGEQIIISACIPAISDQLIDLYLVLISPTGLVLSMQNTGPTKEGIHAYYSMFANTESRTCATLFEYTVAATLPQGQWTAYLAVLPAGARKSLGNAIVYDSKTIEIEH